MEPYFDSIWHWFITRYRVSSYLFILCVTLGLIEEDNEAIYDSKMGKHKGRATQIYT